MSDYGLDVVKESFSRLFVIAISNQMHPAAFTFALGKSDYASSIENKQYTNVISINLKKEFLNISGKECENDSYGVYNDAFWSGQCYFDLQRKINKSFSYIFLKLPLNQMLDIYKIFHEMDFSSLVEYFEKKEKEKTILRLLCDYKKISLNKLSKATSISVNTLSKYNASDEALYKGSFQNIIKIARFFEVPTSLFIETL